MCLHIDDKILTWDEPDVDLCMKQNRDIMLIFTETHWLGIPKLEALKYTQWNWITETTELIYGAVNRNE